MNSKPKETLRILSRYNQENRAQLLRKSDKPDRRQTATEPQRQRKEVAMVNTAKT